MLRCFALGLVGGVLGGLLTLGVIWLALGKEDDDQDRR